MPVETTRIKNDELPVVSGAGTAIENGQIDLVQVHRAFLFGNGARNQFLMPKMVGDNDVIGERRGRFLDSSQYPDVLIARLCHELARKELRNKVMDIQDQFRPSPFW